MGDFRFLIDNFKLVYLVCLDFLRQSIGFDTAMADRRESASSSRSSLRDIDNDFYLIKGGPYEGERLCPVPYHFGTVTEKDRDLVASAFGIVVATWVDSPDNTLVRVMEVRGISENKRNWVLAVFGTDNRIPGDLSLNLAEPLSQLNCTHYIDTDIRPISNVVNSYGNAYTSAICLRVPRSDYHKDVERMEAQKQKDRFNELVRKRGAVFGRFPEQNHRPSTISRLKKEDSDDEDEIVSSSSRSNRLARKRIGANEFKSSRSTKLTTAERFVDNMGALHRVPTSTDKELTVANSRSFGERVRDFFLWIDPNKV